MANILYSQDNPNQNKQVKVAIKLVKHFSYRKKYIYQCQLLTFVESGLSSTIHRGSPLPQSAIF